MKPIPQNLDKCLFFCWLAILPVNHAALALDQNEWEYNQEVAIPQTGPVRVDLPAARSTAPTTGTGRVQPEPPLLASPTGHARILVVDDEPVVCSSLVRLLTREGTVLTVTSAREALKHIQFGQSFDVILCDLMMPGMDAPALYDELIQVAPAQAERMVFMTGGAFTARAREFLARVPNARVDKPFDVAALRALVRARVAPTVD